MAKNGDEKANVPVIGLLAVKNLLITKEELQKGLAACADADNPDQALKEYLIANELISGQNMERLTKAAKALETRQQEFKFGAIAVRKGFINQSVLKLALEEQARDIKNRQKIRMLGDMLVDAGLLSAKQRDYILKLQKRVRQEAGKQAADKKPPARPAAPTAAAADESADEAAAAPAPETMPAEDAPAEEDDSDEDQSGPGLMEPETIDGGLKLEVASDVMSAYLTKTDHFSDDITVARIKEILFEKGIAMGIVEDEMIRGFISSSGFKTKAFMVARGISPIQGKDAKVEFFFNTDYLKAGGVTEDGSIDFKDRGKIPIVEEGTVLAEKIPMVEARRGHSIYGDEIETTPGQDITLKFGKGCKLSEDGFKILAAVKGFPKYALSGHVFVHQEYVSAGDVDFETGHIKYDGNVTVKGRIKSGFRVKGCDVQAIEVDGGQIDADGNVRIEGGINEGKIYARGNVYAKFIHKSEIICMGDVVVQKEVVDSDVECSGTCVAETGTLISSRITAKMGVTAQNIGTETAAPNMIKVAHDAFLEREMEKNKDLAGAIKDKMDKYDARRNELKEENLVLQKQVTDLAHVQDRSQLEEREVAAEIAEMEKSGQSADRISELKEKITQLSTQAQKAEKALDVCFDKTEAIEEEMETWDAKINDLEAELDILNEEKANLIEWGKDNPGKAEVVVKGAIISETLIRGRYSEKRVAETTRHARFSEVQCAAEDGKALNIYEFQVGNI